jgi:hypothetical protein
VVIFFVYFCTMFQTQTCFLSGLCITLEVEKSEIRISVKTVNFYQFMAFSPGSVLPVPIRIKDSQFNAAPCVSGSRTLLNR